MEVLLRNLLNKVETQVIQIFTQLKCSIGKSTNMYRRNYMHFIYFFGIKANAGVFALVHGKENDINVSI
jgi:hypothetical protein